MLPVLPQHRSSPIRSHAAWPNPASCAAELCLRRRCWGSCPRRGRLGTVAR